MRRLPPTLLEWARSQVGDEPLEGTQRLARTSTSEVVGLRAGTSQLVLRWYPDPAVVDPAAIDREVAALTALADSSVPAPRLVATSAADPAAVLMSRVPGRFVRDLPDPGAARAMIDAVHSLDPAALERWTYHGYHEGEVLRRPVWWRDTALWERLMIQTENARPTALGVFIHRDLHPGNLLWSGEAITGVVDWVDACVGPAAVDIGHLRVNLAMLHGAAAADAFDPGDPAWDIEMGFGILDWGPGEEVDGWPGPWPQVPANDARTRLEAFMGHAMARLG